MGYGFKKYNYCCWKSVWDSYAALFKISVCRSRSWASITGTSPPPPRFAKNCQICSSFQPLFDNFGSISPHLTSSSDAHDLDASQKQNISSKNMIDLCAQCIICKCDARWRFEQKTNSATSFVSLFEFYGACVYDNKLPSSLRGNWTFVPVWRSKWKETEYFLLNKV